VTRYRYTGDRVLTYMSYREVYEDDDGVQQHRILVGDPERDEALLIEPVLGDRDEVAGNHKVVTVPGDPVPPNDGLWEEEPDKKAKASKQADKDGE
jgi:hypothetical protein